MIESFNQSLTRLWKSQPLLLHCCLKYLAWGPALLEGVSICSSTAGLKLHISEASLWPATPTSLCTDVCTSVMLPAVEQPPSFHTSPDPDTALGCWLTRGFYKAPAPVSCSVALWDVRGFVCVTGASSALFIPQPACSPSRHPAGYFHGEESICPRGGALLQAVTLSGLVVDHFLLSEGGLFLGFE